MRDTGNWELWLKFFLKGIYEMVQEASNTARQIVAMKETHCQLLLNQMGRRSRNAITLLENLYFRPIISMAHVQEITKLSYPNANTLIRDFCNLEEITGQKRNRAFSDAP